MNRTASSEHDHTTTFVLVHGAWHGGWCWNRVTPLLRAAGHDVYAPTLTGLGERAHLLTPSVDLETHIQDVVNVLFYEDLHKFEAACRRNSLSRAEQRALANTSRRASFMNARLL